MNVVEGFEKKGGKETSKASTVLYKTGILRLWRRDLVRRDVSIENEYVQGEKVLGGVMSKIWNEYVWKEKIISREGGGN